MRLGQKPGFLKRLTGKFKKPRDSEEIEHPDKAAADVETSVKSFSADTPTAILQSTANNPDDLKKNISGVVVSSRDDAGADPASIHKAIWDRAYNNLRESKHSASYVARYEELLLSVFLQKPLINEDARHLGPVRMGQVVAAGLNKIEKYKKFIDGAGSTVNVIEKVKAILDIPLKNIPQTTLPWAVISSTVDVSQGQSSSLKDGIYY